MRKVKAFLVSREIICPYFNMRPCEFGFKILESFQIFILLFRCSDMVDSMLFNNSKIYDRVDLEFIVMLSTMFQSRLNCGGSIQ